MQAVNLIPIDARVGGGAAIGRSGGVVYVMLGGLAVLLVLMGLFALAAKDGAGKRSELSALETQIQMARAGTSNDVVPGQVRQQRVLATDTVRQLTEQRMDWATVLDNLGRTLPANFSLSALDASLTPGAGASSAVPATTAAVATGATGPSVKLTGCAPTQAAVAELMPRLQGVPGVDDVQLVSSSVVTTNAAASGSAETAASSCNGAAFQINLQLTPIVAPAVAAVSGTPTTTAPTTAAPSTAAPTTAAPTTAAPATAAPTTGSTTP